MSKQVGINQGDHIYYYDLSTGAESREWFFQGGSPTGGTAYGPDVRYYSVNYNGYNTTLVITGAGGITAAASKSNIIVVYPEIFGPYITISSGLETISDSPMGKSLTYTIGGTASSGYSNYAWNIPQLGATSGSLLSSVNYATTDWYTLTGTYIGSPNASYLATSLCNVTSIAGNQAALSSNINFRKIGIEESVNYWSPGTYATSGKYYNTSILPIRTSSVDLGGNSLIIKIDLNPYSPRWNNTSFHSTQEAVYFWPNSPDVSKTYSPIKTNIILNGKSLYLAGVTGPYISDPRVTDGNYIIPSGISTNFNNKFYITDNMSELIFTRLVDGNRQWSNGGLTDFVDNKYYLSGSSKFIELGGFYKFAIDMYSLVEIPSADVGSVIAWKNGYFRYLWDGGYYDEDNGTFPISKYHGVCIPSSQLMEELYQITGMDVDVRLILRDSSGSIIKDLQTIVSPGNPYDELYQGNSPDSYLITAQDTVYTGRSGLASRLNVGLKDEGLHTNIVFEANTETCPYYFGSGENTAYPSFFNGIKMSIKNPKTGPIYSYKYIHSLEIMWGTNMQNFINGVIKSGLYPTMPLASDVNASGADMVSWTGLPSKITVPASSYVNYFRGWKIGGSL